MHLVLEGINTVVSTRITYLLSDLSWSTANNTIFVAVNFLYTDNPQVSQQIIGQKKGSSTNTNIFLMTNAALNQTVIENCVVMLDGTGSYDPNGDELIVYWWQSSKNNDRIPTYLSGISIQTSTLVAPLFPHKDNALVTDKSIAINQTPSVVQIHVMKDRQDQNIYDPSNST